MFTGHDIFTSTSGVWSVFAADMDGDGDISPDSTDFETAAVCVEPDDGPNTTATDVTTPAPGEVSFYLIRAENDCPDGAGSTGVNPQGQQRGVIDCS